MEIPKQLLYEINEYCKANKIVDIDKFILDTLKKGFTIQKYGVTPIFEPIEKIKPLNLDVSESVQQHITQEKEAVKKVKNITKIPKDKLGDNKIDLYGE